jgi:signal peptidase I
VLGGLVIVGAVLAVVLTSGGGAAGISFRMTAGSIEPTFKVGQLVDVVQDAAYVPKVGDIVMFHPPAGADPETAMCRDPNQGAGHLQPCGVPTAQESSQLFIKRVVAGPGDTVAIINRHVVRNGSKIDDSSYTEPCGGDPSCNFPTPVTVPPGDYFVLGDNRGASEDSRFSGPVPRSFIVGKVEQ